MKTLVVGATGRVAAALTRQLVADGTMVRAFVRSHEKALAAFGTTVEIIDGAFDDEAVLTRAFDEVDIVFLALGTSQEQVSLEKGLIDGAVRAGVPHIVRLSVLGADKALDTAFYEVARRHGEIDGHLAASGLPHTIIRPTYFMSNLLSRAPVIASSDHWFGAAPNGRVSMVDTNDVAAAAARIIQNKALHNFVYELTGPEALSFREVATTMSDVFGRKIAYVALDAAALRQTLSARIPAWLADIAVGIDLAIEAGMQEPITDTIERLTGSAPRHFVEFARDNRLAFNPSPLKAAD